MCQQYQRCVALRSHRRREGRGCARTHAGATGEQHGDRGRAVLKVPLYQFLLTGYWL